MRRMMARLMRLFARRIFRRRNRVKVAGVYRLRSSSLVHAASYREGWGAADCPPFELLPNKADSEEFGRAMRTVLNAPTDENPIPATEEEWDSLRQNTALAAGVKNYAAFMRQAEVYCGVSEGLGGHQITVERYKKRGRGGFTRVKGDYSEDLSSDASDLELGLAVRRALGLSTG